ncbi:MAG: protein kinase [Pseudomonadota bacterium]
MSRDINVLLVDDCPDFRALVRHYLRQNAPDVTLTDYDPEVQGLPADSFRWSRYDLLLLDYQLGDGGDGLSWLAELRDKDGFPPTVLVTAQGNEYVAVRALKLGAEDYIRKQDLTATRLVEVVREASRGRSPAAAAVPSVNKTTLQPGPEETVVRGINGYRMMRKIGAGTQSRIYLAERLSDDLQVALKIVAISAMDDEDVLRRFEREVNALERIASPHVVRLFDQAFADDCGYIAMEHLPGGDLRERMDGQFDEDVAVDWMRQLLQGLAVIHSAGVIHRDLKPTNVLFRGADTLVIADFGISRPIDTDTEHTTEGMLLGTPAYMSPEQCLGDSVDARSDLYSAGVMFVEMLTGLRPFRGRSVAAILHQHVHEPIPRLDATLAHQQPFVDALLSKQRADRPATAGEALELMQASVH